MEFSTLKQEVIELAQYHEGRIGLVIDTGTDRIMIREEEVFPAASLIKLPILLTCLHQHEKSLLDLQQCIDVPQEQRVGGAGVLKALKSERSWRIIDLMTLMMIVSDNSATNALIDILGMKQVTECIQALHLKKTALNRRMMDSEMRQKGIDNTTCADDMIACLQEIDRGELLTKESTSLARTILAQQQFTKLASSSELETVTVENKTGELPGIEHDCAIFRYRGRTIYAAVLIDHLKERELGRRTIADIGRLIGRHMKQNSWRLGHKE